jgi:hypothetical protein
MHTIDNAVRYSHALRHGAKAQGEGSVHQWRLGLLLYSSLLSQKFKEVDAASNNNNCRNQPPPLSTTVLLARCGNTGGSSKRCPPTVPYCRSRQSQHRRPATPPPLLLPRDGRSLLPFPQPRRLLWKFIALHAKKPPHSPLPPPLPGISPGRLCNLHQLS